MGRGDIEIVRVMGDVASMAWRSVVLYGLEKTSVERVALLFSFYDRRI